MAKSILELLGGSYEFAASSKITAGALALSVTFVIYIITHVIYNLYFHPLAKFPGPKFAAISTAFYCRTVVSGKSMKIMRALHEKYGDIVRWAPDELSFSSAAAWKDIYAPRREETIFLKDPRFYVTDDTLRAKHIVNTPDPADHAQLKKMLNPAFSPKALLEQEPIMIRYADMLMTAILEESRKGPINLCIFYNWVTFDVLGELAFSESFGSTAARRTDDWIATILQMIKFNAYNSAVYRFHPLLDRIMPYIIPREVAKGGDRHVLESKAKILKRMAKGEQLEAEGKRDFCSYIFEKREELGISDWGLAAHAQALIIAGSETSATVLSGLTYWLCRTPDVYETLKREVRSRFKNSEEITSMSATFPYLTAVINETMRIFPPVPIGMPRITPKGGGMVAGVWVPGGMAVGVQMWASTHNPKNFKDPDTFRPERWLDPNCTDQLGASNPFLLGPRACIGQNMAWMELRILIAKMVFLFDFELIDDKLDWDRDGTCFVLWQKPDLMTKVTPVNTA